MGATVETYLEERSKLIFEFYRDNDEVTYRILDFWENIKIKESQKPNLITYNPISRAGSLYSYAGAKSRAFNLSFNITLPNMTHINQLRNIGGTNKFEPTQFFEQRTRTAEALKTMTSNELEVPGVSYYDEEFFYLLDNYSPTDISTAFPTSRYTGNRNYEVLEDDDGNETGETKYTYEVINKGKRAKAISTIMMWVGLIRASVLNDSRIPLNGPPIVRLRHGIMYQDVPCVCTGYNLSIDERGGYDLKTLLPRIISVSMNLEEYRNSGKFERNIPLLRDNLTGWESLIDSPYSSDPGPGPAKSGKVSTDLMDPETPLGTPFPTPPPPPDPPLPSYLGS
jgi:hypothetical protein